jgi:mRNA interferase MazF
LVARRYVPERGDAVWVSMSPASGHEQSGHRPAFVVTPSSYNGKVGLAVMCPITSRAKGYPFEVPLPPGLPVSGAILSDHLKSLDWKERRARKIARLPEDVLAQVLARIEALLLPS